MTAITTRLPAVTVEFDGAAKGKRTTRHFEDANDAKAFYEVKSKAGKNPKVLGDESNPEPTPAVAPNAPAQATPTTTPKPPKVPGVAPNARTRAYHAGCIIRRHGLAAGVTPEMVAELNTEFGTPNDVESSIMLRNGWHCVRAYLEGEATNGTN